MRTSLLVSLVTALVAGSLALASPAGAEETSSDWPVSADMLPATVVVDLADGDGWVLRYDVAHTDRDTIVDLAHRCRAAGLTPKECRRILHDRHSDLGERCRNAGLTAEQCRRIVDHDDLHSIAARCRAAGLTTEECRRLINSLDGGTFAERCRAAGLTAQECRRTINSHDDGDRAADRVTDRVTNRPARRVHQVDAIRG